MAESEKCDACAAAGKDVDSSFSWMALIEGKRYQFSLCQDHFHYWHLHNRYGNIDVSNEQVMAIVEALHLEPVAYQERRDTEDSGVNQSSSDQLASAEADSTPLHPHSSQRGILDTVYELALLWLGDPSARFAKYFAIAGTAMIAAPWWQPVVQQLAVKHLGVPDRSFHYVDQSIFWSGWVFIGIALAVYVWVKRVKGH